MPQDRATPTIHRPTTATLPLGALLLAASVTGHAQQATLPEATLGTVTVRESAAPAVQGKDSLKATQTQIGKGNQALRDIPQSVTVMTEKLIADRNLNDFREVLRTTSGVTFVTGETGEEDVRLRGFSLGQAGDIYTDGMRDGVLYERDTFNNDRIEILKGSASMLFGKGSTGGVVNQVNKQPLLMNQHETNVTLGSGNERRVTGDFNWQTGEDAAFRLNAMVHEADRWGATVKKRGIAPTYRWGIGTRDEFAVSLYHLEVEGRPIYNHPWFVTNGVIQPVLPAKNYYGLASDYQNTSATHGTLEHIHRFDGQAELRTRLRHGRYERDLLASAIRFAPGTTLDNLGPNTVLTRSPKGRVGISDLTQFQSDYSDQFKLGGLQHSLLAGVDYYHDDAQRNQNFAGAASGLNTTVGTPNDGARFADTRGPVPFNTFTARNLGLYAQDTLSLSETVKLVAGLRYDRFSAKYNTPAGLSNERSDGLWSPRLGLLYQPSDTASYYVSYGSSYNTSGDTYQYAPTVNAGTAKTANTPPEKSRNVEVGGKFDLFERRAVLGVAAFYSEKYNERNTDPDTASTQQLLSGKRHAAGMEFNIAGRITPQWEIFANHTWIPLAKIDASNQALAANGGGAQVEGDRPALTPKHSASLWTTYRINTQWRVGAGLNYRGQQNPEGARNVVAAAFTTVDAMAEYQLSEKNVLKLNVTNLGNKRYADTLYRGFYAPGAPRIVQLSLKSSFY